MDYTKNYRLPQWVDEDRIMRQDFNNAMANIENGLTENSSANAETNSRLLRLAYNSWQQLSAMPEIPHQDGAFRQGFANGENPLDTIVPGSPETRNSVNGMAQLPDRLWTANWDKPLQAEDFSSTFRILSAISSKTNSDTCSFTFTPPVSGYLYNLVIIGKYEGNEKDPSDNWTNDGSCTVRIYNDASGELLQEAPSTFGFRGFTGSGGFRVPVSFFLIGKTRYRIEVQMKKMGITLEYTIDPSLMVMDLYGRKQESVRFTRRLQSEESGRDGLVLVRYDTRGPEGSVSIDWMGETLTPRTVRTVEFRGQQVREAEFRPRKSVPPDSTVTLNIRCGKDGEFSLFDWGAVLF